MRKTSLAALFVASMSAVASADAVKVELHRSDAKVTLLRDGQPYFIQGVGGSVQLADGFLSEAYQVPAADTPVWPLAFSLQTL